MTLVGPAPGSAPAGSTARVSQGLQGQAANADSGAPALSGAGRFVAFESDASNLVAGDTNRRRDVFVHDRETGETARVSVASSGAEGNADSGAPAVSGDGRFVAFESDASNLVAGDTNRRRDVFVHDRETGETMRVSVASSGAEGNADSGAPALSADGRLVAFESKATNLVAGDTNRATDIFVHDRVTGETTRVSVTRSGAEADGDSSAPRLSADGFLVAFVSRATNLVAGDTNRRRDVFVHDRETGETTRVSVASSGAEGNADSEAPAISGDGRFVAFESKATNLVPGDTNRVIDVFVHERATATTHRMAGPGAGAQGDRHSTRPALGHDGRFVVFQSMASNLVPGDTNGRQDVFVHDRTTGATTRVSTRDEATEGDQHSEAPAVSADAGAVAFASRATNLTPGDTNRRLDVFVYQRNLAPLARDDDAATTRDVAVAIAVLDNDEDPDGDPLGVVAVTQGARGTVTFDAAGVTYAPGAGVTGDDSFTYTVEDGRGGRATATVGVTITAPPVVNQRPNVLASGDAAVTLPALATLTATVTDDGLPVPPGRVTLTWTKEAGPGEVTFGDSAATATTASFSESGEYVLRLTAHDGDLAAHADVPVSVSAAGGGLPPDPSTVAPALDRTVATNVAAGTEFLYAGPTPIQTGMAPGTIVPRRAAVIRGLVLDESGAPLGGVRITVHAHPEYGQTLSRADGMFDLAVNGGGPLTVRYEKDGFLPADRQVQVPWLDYVWTPDVVLIPRDTQVTTVELPGAIPVQVARGRAVTDDDGTRQATLLFLQGTTAELVLPDGSIQPLAALSVRATEYTVGSLGPRRMPAELPPTSGYTYAVELSVDEAEAAGAVRVRFSQPVVFYVENFVGFPVGEAAPAGFYDRARGLWVPSDSGRVVRIVDITGGLANVDTDGNGVADNTGLGAAERAQLATLYAAGQSLWRVPIPHFSAWDINWGIAPPPDATGPGQPPPRVANQTQDPCRQQGSILECDNQVLIESVPIAGTPFQLTYRSDHVPGSFGALEVSLSGGAIPASLKRIEVNVYVAGRRIEQSLAPAPNLKLTVGWDTLDAYLRQTQGGTAFTVQIGYVYEGVYTRTSRFGYRGTTQLPITGDRASRKLTLWQIHRGDLAKLGGWDARGLGLGGWSVSPHHAYDPGARILHLGTGEEVREAADVDRTITTTAGGGGNVPGDGQPALEAYVQPVKLRVGPDGSVYFTDYVHSLIRRIDPAGILWTIAGQSDVRGFGGDGGPALAALLDVNTNSGIDVAPDGTVYFADTDNFRVRRVTTAGIIDTIAGATSTFVCGTGAARGDGGPATAAGFCGVSGVAVGADGSIYVGDIDLVRRIDPTGMISTVAGGGPARGDGGPATAGKLLRVEGITVAPDGSLYIADRNDGRVRRVGVDGVITTVAGAPCAVSPACFADGLPATQATLGSPFDVTVGADGSFYIAERARHRVRQVGPTGIISIVAGGGSGGLGDGGPGPAAVLRDPHGVALAPDGSLYIADATQIRLRRVAPTLAGFTGDDIVIASRDGRMLHRFGPTGRHLDTTHAFTGAELYRFTYDAGGRLVQIRDGDGNVTTIERDAAGQPLAVVAPLGQRTALGRDAGGYLASIANPAGEAAQFTYSGGGLLTTATSPRGDTHAFTYDITGRLVRDDDPAGGFQTLTRTEQANGVTVTRTTALGLTTTYQAERDSAKTARRIVTGPGGRRHEAVFATSGVTTVTYPDGTVTTLQLTPDPRWGMQAPVAGRATARTPSGLTLTVTSQRFAELADPADPLSLVLSEYTAVNGRTFSQVWDALARTYTISTPGGRQTVLEVDGQGRATSVARGPGLDPITMDYDAAGRMTRMAHGGQQLTYTHDARGRVATRSDGTGTVQYSYDAADRVVSVTLPSGRRYQYVYDANGRRTQVVMPSGAVHTLAHTPVDLPAGYTPPGGPGLTRAYDLDRKLTRTTLAGGRTVDTGYDAAGRAESVAYPEATVTLAYAGATGRLARMTRAPAGGGPAQVVDYSHDGHLRTRATASGVAAGDYRYRYDSNHFLVGLTLDAEPEIALGRDADGLLTGYGPFAIVRLAPLGMPSGLGDGTLQVAYSYDGLGRLAGRTHTVGGTPVYALQITRNGTGRITGRVETALGVTRTFAYGHDADGQLLEARQDGALVEQYAYDVNGNRLTVLDGTTATYDAQDRLAARGTLAYQFDADGFLAARGADTFQYGARGELVQATVGGATIAYAYDGLGRRVARTDGTGTTQYLYGNPSKPFQLTATRNPAGGLSVYYYDEAGLLFAFRRGGAWYYVASDQVGSPRVVTDAAGVVQVARSYDSFGVVLADTDPGFELPVGFAGGLADAATGLVRFGFRDYEPRSGRWAARDPVLFAGSPDNLYAYVGNNPVNFVDPTGLWCAGASLYEGVGGGIKVCQNDDGRWAACIELGVGIGGGVSISEGFERAALSVESSISVKSGIMGGTFGVKVDSCGEGGFILRQSLGFFTSDILKDRFELQPSSTEWFKQNVGAFPKLTAGEGETAIDFKVKVVSTKVCGQVYP